MVVAQKTITGVVSDNEGLPLPGATIVVEGTSTGVTTDFDGNFSITAEEGDTLNISYVGYQSQSIVVGDQDTLNISLELGNELEEVVVTALGFAAVRDQQGSTSSVIATDDVIRSALPEDMLRVFMHYKNDEWEKYLSAVTQWDVDTYLDVLP